MSRWREKIDLNGVLARLGDEYDLSRVEEPIPEPVKEAICGELAKSTWLSRFAADIRSAASIAAGNRVLERVFDAADRYKVWCGMPS